MSATSPYLESQTRSRPESEAAYKTGAYSTGHGAGSHGPTHGPTHGRTLTELISDLWRESFTLVRAETELAKAEISEKVSEAKTGLVSLAIGGAVTFAGFMVLLWAAVSGLALAMPDSPVWMPPLIVGAVVLIIGLLLLNKGRSNLDAKHFTPSRTADSLRRDGALAREHMR